MTLLLPGLAAWANEVIFGDFEAKCAENRQKFQIYHKTLLTILTPILKPALRNVQANLNLTWQTQFSDDDD